LKLGVAFGWHSLPWESLLELVRKAEAQGFDTAYVDGDVSQLGSRRDADVLDGWTVTVALLAATTRIRIGSIRLVHHWNTARLAQAVASAERIFPGRLRFFTSIGERPEDARFGLPQAPVAERIAWLDESLDALRALWRGEDVTRAGRFVRLDRARVRPTPRGGVVAIEVGARRPRLLEVVARHADAWNVNLPPIPARVAEAEAALAAACARVGRDPRGIARRMLIFARARRDGGCAGALAEFRRLNPWFGDLSDAEVGPALAVGDAAECRAQVEALARPLALELPILDLTGADAAAAHDTLNAFPAGVLR
jgi:alkanesulfonate monooxygenase SsuD/methylene tetrahydromethanopterin reductase-like flavin-dependent oxidoreductase (luciferase family)